MNRNVFQREFAQIIQCEGLEQAVRWSGEELAKADAALRHAASSGGATPLDAEDFLFVADAHIACLGELNLDMEALGTVAMALVNILRTGVQPPQIRQSYIMMLLKAVHYAYKLHMESGDVAVADSVESILSQQAALFIASYDEFMGENAQNRFLEIRALVPEGYTFFGRKVVPTLAIDIFADTLARLYALQGVENV